MNDSTRPSPGKWSYAVLTLLVLSLPVSHGQRAKSQARAAVPAEAELAKAESSIRNLFKDEYASTKAGDRLALSKKLLAQAQDTTNDLASRYVLFRESSDLAARAGYVGQAMQALDEMGKVFVVNIPGMKLGALQVVASLTRSQQGNDVLVQTTLPVAQTAMRQEDFDTADRLIKVADGAARLAKSADRQRSVAALSTNLDAMRKEHAKAMQAVELLTSDPENADANLTLGRYQCFYKEDWTAGLPRLAHGSDAPLKTLAEKTIKESDEMATIAGAWWDLADKLSAPERDAVRRFSADRYRTAWPKLNGLQRQLAEKRITEGERRSDRRVYDLIPLIDPAKDALHGSWRIEKNQLHCDTTHFVPRIQIPYQPPDEYDFLATFTQPSLRNGVNLIMPNKHRGSFFWTVSSENGTGYGLSIGGSNAQTKLPKENVIRANTVHTTMVQVRRDGVKCYLDGVLLREHKTDFKDLLVDSWRETKDRSILAVACDDPTVFQAIHIIEFEGAGKRTR